MRSLYRFLSLWGNVKAASRGPGPYVRRQVRRRVVRDMNRELRRIIKP